MKINYFESDDTLQILFRDAPIQHSEMHPAGLVLDYDQNGVIVGLELTMASLYLSKSPDAPLIEVRSIPGQKELPHDSP